MAVLRLGRLLQALGIGLTAGLLLAPSLAGAEPLSLDQALDGLEEHPRVLAAAEWRARLPRRQDIYLDCNRLAFSHSTVADPARDQPHEALLDPLTAQRLEVMARFFDVLLADASFASASEAMAVAFLQFDRAAVRRELGQISPLRVAELEAVYQAILQQRAASELSRRLTRSLLAQALGQPASLPRELLAPAVGGWPERAPDLETLYARALAAPALGTRMRDLAAPARELLAMELRQQLAELLLRLEALRAAQRQIRTESVWRELKLDESRILYELEAAADLGYSMSQQSQTQVTEQRVAFCQALTWAELQALAGRSPWPPSAEDF